MGMALAGAGGPENRQFLGMRHRKTAEQYFVRDREDGHIGADTERQRQNRYQSKGGVLAQRSRAVDQIPPDCLQKTENPHAPYSFQCFATLPESWPSKFPRCRGRGFKKPFRRTVRLTSVASVLVIIFAMGVSTSALC